MLPPRPVPLPVPATSARGLVGVGLLLGAVLAWPGAAAASETDKPAKPAKPSTRLAPAASAPAAAPAAAPARDPLDVLRERLAEKLGSSLAGTEVARPGVLKVVTRSEGGAAAASAGAGQARRQRAPRAGAAPGSEAMAAAAMPTGAERPAGTQPAGWSYSGATGPEQWGRLNPDYSLCSSGQRQSPIDIRGGVQVALDPLQFDYQPSRFSVVNTGHTVRVEVPQGNQIEVMGQRYTLAQIEFRHPAEERINGRSFEMGMHLIHRNPQGQTVVVAVLFEPGAVQPVIERFWANLPLEPRQAMVVASPVDLASLLPADRGYYIYMGSMTTPPCQEGVVWAVMQQPVGLDSAQIEVFRHLYPMNARPLQASGDRLIKGPL